MLLKEKESNVLNTIALCLGKLKINDAVPILMEFIINPDFKNKRGSFIYALLGLDCKKYFLVFVNLMCEGDFEVFTHSFMVFETILDFILAFFEAELSEYRFKLVENHRQRRYGLFLLNPFSEVYRAKETGGQSLGQDIVIFFKILDCIKSATIVVDIVDFLVAIFHVEEAGI